MLRYRWDLRFEIGIAQEEIFFLEMYVYTLENAAVRCSHVIWSCDRVMKRET